MYIRRILYLFFLLQVSVQAYSSTDSTELITLEAADTASSASKHSPPLATIMSAIIPGAGQIYNHKYWKVPVIYAGLVGLGYGVYYHNYEYQYYDKLIDRYNGRDSSMKDGRINIGTRGYASVDNVKAQRNDYRRIRDLYVIIMGGWYILNIIDANVDAHFFDYDIGDDLSFQWQPVIMPHERQTAYVGAHFVFRF